MGMLSFTVPTCCTKFLHDTWELSAVQKEREGGRELSVLPVMYGSAHPLRSLSSMIIVLINMCFITPLKHTNCTYTLSQKWTGSSVRLNMINLLREVPQVSISWVYTVQYVTMLNQGLFHQKWTCYTCNPVLSASQAENKSLTRHTHTKPSDHER